VQHLATRDEDRHQASGAVCELGDVGGGPRLLLLAAVTAAEA
jgi:hypothetical protein